MCRPVGEREEEINQEKKMVEMIVTLACIRQEMTLPCAVPNMNLLGIVDSKDKLVMRVNSDRDQDTLSLLLPSLGPFPPLPW